MWCRIMTNSNSIVDLKKLNVLWYIAHASHLELGQSTSGSSGAGAVPPLIEL